MRTLAVASLSLATLLLGVLAHADSPARRGGEGRPSPTVYTAPPPPPSVTGFRRPGLLPGAITPYALGNIDWEIEITNTATTPVEATIDLTRVMIWGNRVVVTKHVMLAASSKQWISLVDTHGAKNAEGDTTYCESPYYYATITSGGVARRDATAFAAKMVCALEGGKIVNSWANLAPDRRSQLGDDAVSVSNVTAAFDGPLVCGKHLAIKARITNRMAQAADRVELIAGGEVGTERGTHGFIDIQWNSIPAGGVKDIEGTAYFSGPTIRLRQSPQTARLAASAPMFDITPRCTLQYGAEPVYQRPANAGPPRQL